MPEEEGFILNPGYGAPFEPPESRSGKYGYPKGAFEGKTCSLPNAVTWVLENLHRQGVTYKDAPSAKAWSIYAIVKGGGQPGEQAFMEKVMVRFLPTQKEVDDENRLRDDGADAKDIIARLRAAGVAVNPPVQRDAGGCAVPPSADEPGESAQG
jgi:hypothetical protein